MKSNRVFGLGVGGSAFGTAALLCGLLVPTVASAQEACGEQTCPKGYACEDVPAPCLAIACVDGQDCPVCAETQEACVALPCDSDSDCASDMVCLREEVTECSGGEAAPCAPGQECAPPRPTECTTETRTQCVPRWALPCQTSEGCGPGFECVAQESCTCSGSAGSGSGSSGTPTPGAGTDEPLPTEPNPAPDAPAGRPAAGTGGAAGGSTPGAAPSAPTPPETDPDAVPPVDVAPPPGPDCECKPSDTKACQLIETACSSDAECPSGWQCGDNPEGVCWGSSDGSSGCTPADPAKLCLPPYTNLEGGGFGRGEGGEPTTGGGTTNPTPGKPVAGGEEPPIAPTPDAAENAANAGDGADADSRGCSVSAGSRSAGAGVGLFALGALFALFARRPSRRRSTAS